MKKKLPLLLATMFAMQVNAANITESFANNPLSLGTKSNTETVTVPSQETGITYTVYCGYYFEQGGAILFGKKDAYVEFTLPIDCSTIKATTPTGSSGKVTVQLLANGTALDNLSFKANQTFTWVIPSELQAKGTTYKLLVTNANNCQISKLFFEEASSETSLTMKDEGSVDFIVPLNGTLSKTVSVIKTNLSADVNVAVTGEGFSVTPAVLTGDETDVTVTYTGTTAVSVTGMVTFTCGDLKAEAGLTGLTLAHAGTEADPLTTDDVVAMNNQNVGPYYVEGTIAGCGANNGVLAETNVASNVALATSNPTFFLPVAIPVGASRTEINIVDNPDNLGRSLVVKGTLEAYFGVTGIKNATFVRWTSTTGIDAVEAEEAEAVYYNLQGVRVDAASATPGLYVVRQGKRTSKVVVK